MADHASLRRFLRANLGVGSLAASIALVPLSLLILFPCVVVLLGRRMIKVLAASAARQSTRA